MGMFEWIKQRFSPAPSSIKTSIPARQSANVTRGELDILPEIISTQNLVSQEWGWCDPAWQDEPEARKWAESPAVTPIPRLFNSGQFDEAKDLLASMPAEFGDWDFVAIWRANLLFAEGNATAAIEGLFRSLPTVKRKSTMAQKIAEFAFRSTNRIEVPTHWWIIAIRLQERSGLATDHSPFLFLSEIARALGELSSFESLIARSDSICCGNQFRLDAKVRGMLNEAVRGLDVRQKTAIRTAIQSLTGLSPK